LDPGEPWSMLQSMRIKNKYAAESWHFGLEFKDF